METLRLKIKTNSKDCCTVGELSTLISARISQRQIIWFLSVKAIIPVDAYVQYIDSLTPVYHWWKKCRKKSISNETFSIIFYSTYFLSQVYINYHILLGICAILNFCKQYTVGMDKSYVRWIIYEICRRTKVKYIYLDFEAIYYERKCLDRHTRANTIELEQTRAVWLALALFSRFQTPHLVLRRAY